MDQHRQATILHSQGLYEQAIAVCSACIADEPSDVVAHLRRGQSLAALEQRERAREDLSWVTRQEGADELKVRVAFQVWIDLERADGKLEAALRVSEACLEWDPTNDESAVVKVELLEELGRRADAVAWLTARLAEADDDLSLALLKLRAGVHERCGDSAAPAADRERAGALECMLFPSRDDGQGCLLRARAEADPIEARRLADVGVALEPNNVELLIQRATYRMNRWNDPHGAIEDFTAALAVTDDRVRVLESLLRAHRIVGDVAACCADLDALIPLSPDPTRYARRAFFLEQVGRPADALADIDKALPHLDPDWVDHAELLALRARCNTALGQTGEAQDRERALMLQGTGGAAKALFGVLFKNRK